MMDWQEHLHLAARAAQAAGAHLRDALAREKTVLSNAGKDTKLQADRDAEALIFQFLEDSPYAVVAEESGAHGDPGGAAPWWAVDPLDGTVNFSRGIPVCCVSIGMLCGNEPWLGVIYDFNREELFTGAVGEGAWLNGEPIKVSPLEEPEQAIFCTASPAVVDQAAMDRYIEIGRRFKKIRMLGSAAIALAYVACGRVDVFMDEDLKIWDAAAGAALIRAAGGHVRLNENGLGKWNRSFAGACHPDFCGF